MEFHQAHTGHNSFTPSVDELLERALDPVRFARLCRVASRVLSDDLAGSAVALDVVAKAMRQSNQCAGYWQGWEHFDRWLVAVCKNVSIAELRRRSCGPHPAAPSQSGAEAKFGGD